jgi:hypothetical protein
MSCEMLAGGNPFGSLEASEKTCWTGGLKESLPDLLGRWCFWQFHGSLPAFFGSKTACY